jgi:hypothetical protein
MSLEPIGSYRARDLTIQVFAPAVRVVFVEQRRNEEPRDTADVIAGRLLRTRNLAHRVSDSPNLALVVRLD